ncbi:nuclear transport factor 2 family protein [Limibacter armeniacum]|uniref:nuclear transport factor 2 family protein n=1 Tax=Limibacter armeniacum TaxID=466084 RepID=UPI002FE597E7
MKVKVIENCGNSPKQHLLKEVNIAFAAGNVEFLLAHVTEDIIWTIVGDKTIVGKQKFHEALQEMKSYKTSEVIIDKILTHGKEGAANGIMKMESGNSYAFADFYEFSSAKGVKIKAISSYVVEI